MPFEIQCVGMLNFFINMVDDVRCFNIKCLYLQSFVFFIFIDLHFTQSSVNYSKKTMKTHHGEVSVVVQTNAKHIKNGSTTNNK